MSVRVRIAPSPTGDPHVGTAYMALFNYIFARHHQGTFVLRIEDTDRARSKPEYEQNIFRALEWCGVDWDEGPDKGGEFGPYRQSERLDLYKKYADQLIEEDKAYHCFATSEELQEMRETAQKEGRHVGYDRRYRDLSKEEVERRLAAGESYVVRMKAPLEGTCTYEDAVKGTISCPWADVDDQVLLKSDDFPTYHLANVVDDHLMGITHVIRGDEWLTSMPKHVYLYEAFGWQPPILIHMPLLLGTDGKKLSKRKNPTSIFFYRDSGYMKEAFLNFLTLMGYSMPDDKEIYSLEEVIEHFNVKRIGTSGAVFDIEKLNWLNQQYIINQIPEESLWNRIRDWGFSEEKLNQLMPLVHKRLETFGDFISLCDFFFITKLNYTKELFASSRVTEEQSAQLMQAMIWHMEENEAWDKDGCFTASKEVAGRFGVNHKKVIMPLLFAAVMGKKQGPPFFDSVGILGKDLTRARLLHAIQFLGGISKKKMDKLKKAWERAECEALMATNS